METLSAKQQQVALLMSSGEGVSAVAEAYLNGLKLEIINSGMATIQSSVTLAIQTITTMMVESGSDAVRLNCAKEILNRAGISQANPIGSDDLATLQLTRSLGSFE
jgi:hypothetical protein